MKHSSLIFIDTLFNPIYLLLNMLKWKDISHDSNTNFVVVKFFGLGSITRIVHVIDAITIPREKVLFITLKKNKPIIEALGLRAIYINTKHPLVLISSLIRLIIQVWKYKETTILDMERASNISGLFRLLIGIGKPCHSFFFKLKNQKARGQFFVSLKNKPATNAIAELFLKKYTSPIIKEVQTPNTDKIFVNINAGDYLPERKFTRSKYADLLKTLHNENRHWHFYLTGSKREYTHVSNFKSQLKSIGIPSEQVVNIAGEHTVTEFINVLKKARLFITNDSGPLHFAHLFGVKTVGIWGPTNSHLVGYSDSDLMLNLNTKMDCAPCFVNPKSKVAKICNGEITCFKNRDSKEMASKIISFVKQEKDKELIA